MELLNDSLVVMASQAQHIKQKIINKVIWRKLTSTLLLNLIVSISNCVVEPLHFDLKEMDPDPTYNRFFLNVLIFNVRYIILNFMRFFCFHLWAYYSCVLNKKVISLKKRFNIIIILVGWLRKRFLRRKVLK